jgi:hypothetical protein
LKKFVAIAFAAASLLAGPAVFVGTSSSAVAQQQCLSPDVPEGWKRPGGFCEQLNDLGSTIEQPKDECTYQMIFISSLKLKYGESVLVAEADCDYYPQN